MMSLRKQATWTTLGLSFLASTAMAQATFNPITTKDWVLEDLGAVCLAHTQRVIENQTYRLEMQIDKSAQFPVEVFVREVPAGNGTQYARFVYDKSKGINYDFSPLADASGNVSLYQVPRGSTALVSYIKRSLSLPVEFVSAGVPARKVDFSLRGSSVTLDNLIARCNAKKALTSNEFEKNFFDLAKLLALDPLSLRPDQVARLRNAYLSGHQAYVARDAKQGELQALTNKYMKQLRELDRLKGSLDNLTQKELANLNARKATLDQKIADLDKAIASKQGEIAAKDQELQQRNAAYDAAWQVLAPLKPEHDRLQSSLGQAQNSLNSWNNRLGQIDSGIRNTQSEIANLNSEADQVRRQLSSVDSDLDRARRNLNDAENELRRFDPRRELQERLRRQPGYDMNKRDVERFERELQQAERQVDRAERELDQKRRQLDQCRTQPNANCAGEQSAVQQARQDVQRERQDVQRLRGQLQNARQQVDWAERRAENEVRDIENRLRNEESDARRRYSNLESQRHNLDSRLRNIVNYEIPNRQNTINALRSERPSVVSNINSWQGEVASRKKTYDDYKASVGWDAKKAAVDQTAAEVSRVKKELQKLEAENTALANELAKQKKSLASLMKEIEAILAKIEETEGKSAEVQELLKPYFEAKAKLEAEITGLNQLFESNKAAYNGELGA